METSNKSIERLIVYRRKIHTLAMLSGLLTCILAVALAGVNHRLVQLNEREIDELNQEKRQTEDNLKVSVDLEDALAKTKKEIDELKKHLNAEKQLNSSLKSKLSQTLKQLAQIQTYQERTKEESSSEMAPNGDPSNEEADDRVSSQPKVSENGLQQPRPSNLTKDSAAIPLPPTSQPADSTPQPPIVPKRPSTVPTETETSVQEYEPQASTPQQESKADETTSPVIPDTNIQQE